MPPRKSVAAPAVAASMRPRRAAATKVAASPAKSTLKTIAKKPVAKPSASKAKPSASKATKPQAAAKATKPSRAKASPAPAAAKKGAKKDEDSASSAEYAKEFR